MLTGANRDVLSKLALHTDITHDLFKLIDERNLKSLGELEQDLVYGDKHSKDFIYWLSEHQNALSRDKVKCCTSVDSTSCRMGQVITVV